ncbi:MAG: hypothetical protein KF708_15350 [Pirellulales bacterium]|nr:hypothetical protein [Pirellulales bacterium]
MSRRRKEDDDGISLFPFLSVLACVIGLFTLLITAFAVVQIDTDGVAQAEELEHLDSELVAADAELAELEAQSAAAGEKVQELARLQAELNKITAQLDQLKARLPADESPVDIEALRNQIKAIEEEIAKLKEQVGALEKQVADLPEPPKGAVVEIRPGGTGVDIEPTFVECRSDSIVLLDAEPPKRIPRSEIATNADFLAALAHISRGEKRSVIFLLRSDAIDVYYAAADVARRNYARNGKLPVVGQGEIDLSVFRRHRP